MIFLILKIIGIILITVLVLVLAVICLVLFAPVRCRLNGSFHEERPAGSFYAGWLLGLLSFRAVFDKDAGLSACIALFGHKIYDVLGGDDKSSSEADDTGCNEAGGNGRDSVDSNTAAEITDVSKTGEADKSNCNQESGNALESDITHKDAEAESYESETKLSHNESIAQESDAADKAHTKSKSSAQNSSVVHHDIAWHIGKLLRKISDKLKKICEPVNNKLNAVSDAIGNAIDKAEAGIRDRLSELKEMLLAAKSAYDKRTGQIGELYALYKDERYQPAVTMLKKCIIGLLKELKPRKGNGRLQLGFDDPYTTGQAMQAAAMIYPIIWEHIEIIPDFDKPVIDADINVKGRLRLIVPAVSAVRIFFSRDLRAMYKRARKILESDEQ